MGENPVLLLTEHIVDNYLWAFCLDSRAKMKSLALSWDFCHFSENTCADQTVSCKHFLKKVLILSTLSPDMHVFKVALGWVKPIAVCTLPFWYHFPVLRGGLLFYFTKILCNDRTLFIQFVFRKKGFPHSHGSHDKLSKQCDNSS